MTRASNGHDHEHISSVGLMCVYMCTYALRMCNVYVMCASVPDSGFVPVIVTGGACWSCQGGGGARPPFSSFPMGSGYRCSRHLESWPVIDRLL